MDISEESSGQKNKKAITIISIMVVIALMHFVTGPSYSGPFSDFVNGYLIDIILPFGVYFLLDPRNPIIPAFRHWYAKAIVVLAIGFTVEISQYLGVPIFGSTYDPWDFAAYLAGVILAIIFDLCIFPKIFGFWNLKPIVSDKENQ